MQAFSTTLQFVPEGVVLAQPVLDGQAQLLLPAGSPVTGSVLRSLRLRGIETVFVMQAEPLATVPATDPRAQQGTHEEAHARLQHLFRPALRMGQLNPLLHLILRYRTTKTPMGEP